MSIRITIGNLQPLGRGVWTSNLNPEDVRRLGGGGLIGSARSVLGVAGSESEASSNQIFVHPEDITVFAVGTSSEAVIIDLHGVKDKEAFSRPELKETSTVSSLGRDFSVGDASFLNACRHYLSDPLVELAQTLLERVRERFPGEMREGLARKWVNQPNNFVAITIQNRDQSLAIHVKGNADNFLAPSLNIKPDRGSYCRFKINSRTQLDDAVRVVMNSAEKNP